ncbi:primosomal protein DnaI [Mammaliicoccus stepanovicii]|uniref:Primosomal protein DnaI n=1 Tax=Mammaliicoccus stepanovicii TaxID=643214 RepID=A0A239Z1S7_9STAP|nr:primosomal protein DnaI [Mammaliicoccus stepanovicii]PNZ78084.1 primosomal protein DnaI [Mammaliicoccus stepanovicii]GGI40307.1 primosomal protein DnaI [Mammaliicoccus stepanovicii]SNV64930.1 primosomal protein DnaI [Mammaliicoccus stepanovicii]
MEPLGQHLKQNKDFQKRLEKIKKETLSHSEVKTFLREHQSELTNSIIETDLDQLQAYKDQSKCCEKCESYQKCINFVKGHVPELYVQNEHIKTRYLPCPNKIEYDANKFESNLVTSFQMPEETLKATIKDIYVDNEARMVIIKKAMEICNKIVAGEETKGLYIHGPFGTGKSYILGAISNQLKMKKQPSMIIYLPEFIRVLKNGFKDGSFSDRFESAREAKVLMLDDIGAEELTPWVRDEILGPLLHYRMVHKMPTFFSSNFNFEELEFHLSKTRQGAEITKASRIMERIKTITEAYELEGKNYRS